MEKFLCIKSYNEFVGHGTCTHLAGKIYSGSLIVSNSAPSGYQVSPEYLILDEHDDGRYWNIDLFNEYFQSMQEARHDKLKNILDA